MALMDGVAVGLTIFVSLLAAWAYQELALVLLLACYILGYLAWADFAIERFDWALPWRYVSTVFWPLVVVVLGIWRLQEVLYRDGPFEPPLLSRSPSLAMFVTERLAQPPYPAPPPTSIRQPIRAFRRWRVYYKRLEDAYYLQSINFDTVWDGPIMRADQKPEFDDRLGHTAWGPGIYAWTLTGAPWGDLRVDGTIMTCAEGEVELLGRVIRHGRGYRAEMARVKRLILRNMPGPQDRDAEIVRQLGERYDCDVTLLPHPDIDLHDLHVPDDVAAIASDDEHEDGLITMAEVIAAINAVRPPKGLVRPPLHHLGPGVMAVSNCVILGSVTNGHR